MDNDTAKIAAQEIDPESPGEDVGNLEKKIDQKSSLDGSQPEDEHPAKESDTDQKDVEAVETRIEEPEPVRVPRSQRRGLFGRFAILAEVEEPKHYSRRAKWYITFVVSLAAVAAPLGSTIVFRRTPDQSIAAQANIPSFTPSNFRRPTHLSHNHEPLSRLVYAFNVHIPTLVVFILRDSGTTHHLPHIVHSLFTVQCPCGSVKEHRHADSHANTGWWGSG